MNGRGTILIRPPRIPSLLPWMNAVSWCCRQPSSAHSPAPKRDGGSGGGTCAGGPTGNGLSSRPVLRFLGALRPASRLKRRSPSPKVDDHHADLGKHQAQEGK
jgi:hypothetical protein